LRGKTGARQKGGARLLSSAERPIHRGNWRARLAARVVGPIPTGLNQPAQGCPWRATLGTTDTHASTLKGLHPSGKVLLRSAPLPQSRAQEFRGLHPPRPADYLPCVRSLPLFLPLLPLVAAIHLTAPALRASAPPDPETGFRARADQILSARADEDGRELIDWARRIKLGDPHKYLFPVILAKAWRDPKDPVAWDMARFLRDVDQEKAKGDRGLYHFAAIGLTRLQFGFEKELPEDLRAWYAENAGGNLGKFRAGGTENHGMMSRTSGYVFAERFQKERGGPPESDHLAYFRAFLEREGRKLYTIGMGEWDSSTYVAFSLAGWMNVYDFAQDPEARALAKAALDWYASMMALKQFHGVHAGCEARGFANRPVDTQTDIISWLWWGTAPEGFKPDLVSNKGGRYAVIAALSGYRPPAELTALARKEVALPFQARMSKPSYYGYSEDNVSRRFSGAMPVCRCPRCTTRLPATGPRERFGRRPRCSSWPF
jgi:hypothetical protein